MLNEPVRGRFPEPSFLSLTGLEQVRAYMRGLVPITPRFVLVHLIAETVYHAGHADSTREILDGATSLGVD